MCLSSVIVSPVSLGYSLLGHNGAGKTTLISMIAGLFPADSGAIYLNGYKVGPDMRKIYDILGVCTQVRRVLVAVCGRLCRVRSLTFVLASLTFCGRR